MFKNKRYATIGFNELDETIKVYLFFMIDTMPSEIEKDYLQCFDLYIEDGVQCIKHYQETPEYEQTVRLDVKAPERKAEGKIFIIDDGDHTTAMLAHEY